MLNDRCIWEHFKNEEDEAISYIYHQNIDFLFYYGKKVTDDEQLILDTIQDLFYYLISNRKSLGKTDNIRFYLTTAFRRRLFKELKNKKKELLLEEEAQLSPEITFSIEEDIIRNEDQETKSEMIKKGMKKLNTTQREILYYKFNCNFNYDQICEIMSISYDSARQLVSRAIQSLKKFLS